MGLKSRMPPVFVILRVLALPSAFAISNPQKVLREDGTDVEVDTASSTREQIRILGRALTSKRIGCLLPIFFGLSDTYFSVRARALGSFLSAITGVVATTLLGFFLDAQNIHTTEDVGKARRCLLHVTCFGILIWAIVVEDICTHKGNMVQNYLYRAVGSLGPRTNELTLSAGLLRGIEARGQCAAFGINLSKFSPLYILYTVVIIIAFWSASLPPAWLSLSKIGDGGSLHVERPLPPAV
ncbi:putative ion channel regulatory protein UNC-93 [Lyophyllum shimeji]|uniref:Ion channel regulatory protein UNC-93 n=1 Tax=Lyophyllum shimeji TaxID=47721 RepID=A0A9P3UT13_LYOSH|nr:putative ion channel regulatory protein UNC-93 [Lyophyllum shimeji]